MMMDRCVFALVLTAMVTFVSTAPCSMSDDECRFVFDVRYMMTMVKDGNALFPEGGKLYKYDVTNTSSATPVDPEGVITADGWEDSRLVIVVNGQLPGPPIEVYKGQTVVVTVHNNLPSDSISVHWHGVPNVGRPWMDGMAFVTQCPILPGQRFTYRFKAMIKGTYWYHSHIGLTRSMGLHGPLIIREKKPLRNKEFLLTVAEWNHDWDSNLAQVKEEDGMFVNRREITMTSSLDGALFSLLNFQSALINGKGRYYLNGLHNGAPLEIFTVTKGASFIFRVISSGIQYPFRISIDNHDLTMIASDGFDIQPLTAESFIINPGERYDFKIDASASVGNYWIRAMTLEVEFDHFGVAILRYEGAPETEPNTYRRSCTQINKCVVVNCPFLYYPTEQNIECVTFNQIKNRADDQAPGGDIDDDQEIFLNFAFPGIDSHPGSVNGRSFRTPAVSALTQPCELEHQCKDDCGEEKLCKCSYTIDLEHDKTYQMIFLNMGNGKNFSHPIHMHGHSFHVLKMGYPRYDNKTGKIIGDNLDINCRGHPDREKSFCNDATWANPEWRGGNVPGMELQNPPRKDTIIVPTGGYVVVRITADNPGVWFMHCHIELHNMDGMALMLNESFGRHPPPPKGFPTCRNFDYDDTDVPCGNKRKCYGDDDCQNSKEDRSDSRDDSGSDSREDSGSDSREDRDSSERHDLSTTFLQIRRSLPKPSQSLRDVLKLLLHRRPENSIRRYHERLDDKITEFTDRLTDDLWDH